MNDNQKAAWREHVDRYAPQMIRFCQRLVQTPSTSGQERNVALLIESEMKRLAYDEVWIDEWGNVIGLLRGRRALKSVMFNAHMDTVAPDNASDWPHPPYSGEIHDGLLWGRGAADMKGPLAAMVYAAGILASEEIRPPGDLYVACVVHEEVFGLGTRKLLETLRTDYALVGEASNNQLARGQRGRIGLVVDLTGKSVHASMPHRGVNPYQVLSRFLLALEDIDIPNGGQFGASTVAPTRIESEPTDSNVIPASVRLHLDWRNVPGENGHDVIAKLQPLLDSCVAQVDGSNGRLQFYSRELQTWTGKKQVVTSICPPFGLDNGSPLLNRAKWILGNALNRPVETIIWPFGTDGGHLAAAGIPTIGFGPGDPNVIHTSFEHIPITGLVEGMVGYVALAMELGVLNRTQNPA